MSHKDKQSHCNYQAKAQKRTKRGEMKNSRTLPENGEQETMLFDQKSYTDGRFLKTTIPRWRTCSSGKRN